MSIGEKIQWIRLQQSKTQLAVAAASGPAVSYVLRLENNRITPAVRTVGKSTTFPSSLPTPACFSRMKNLNAKPGS